jgi:hypothetical protein
MIVFYAVADGVFRDPYRKWFAFFFAAASNTFGLLTNGSLAVAGSLVFLTVLLNTDAKTTPQRLFSASILIPAGAAFSSVLFAFLINNNTLMLASLAAILLLFNSLNRTGSLAGNLASNTFASVIWSIALMFVHRGSYLFVPTVITSWLFYIVVSGAVSKATLGWLRSLWTTALLLPFVCVCILSCVVAVRLGYLPSIKPDKLFSPITLLLFGRAIKDGDEIALGAGPEIAAIEVGRAMGPLFTFGIGLLIAWWCSANPPTKLKQLAASPRQSENAARLLWSWIAGCGLCLILLTGFPFLYRVIFITSGFFTIATTELVNQLLVDPLPDPVKRRRFVAGIAVIAVAALVAGLYAFGWPPDLPHSGYQATLRQSMMIGCTLLLLLAAVTFTRSRQVQIACLAAVIGLGVAIDRSGLWTLFRVYSYGRLPDQASVVSHYDASDLETDRWLHYNMRKAVIISDPYTLGMAKAIAGVPGIYLFSNLDTVNQETASSAKVALSAILEPTGNAGNVALRTCASIAPLLANLNQEALAQMRKIDPTQGILKPVSPERLEPVDPAKLEPPGPNQPDSPATMRGIELLDGPQGKWNVVAIINPRTIHWLHLNDSQRLSYFPIDQPLDPDTLDRIHHGPFRVLFSDGQNAAILIECRDP